jgi:hypothetical protein
MTRLFLAILLFLPLTLRAQLHPTVQRPKADWMQLNTPHFRILYPAGYESTAIETGKILESQVEATTAMFGSSIEALPVVVDPFSHAGNGYVTVFPYRIEYNTAPVKGMIINPRSGTWLEAMLPHELVHAAHINTIPETSIPKLLSVFSPDFARAMHFTTPAGVLEGLAVHHNRIWFRGIRDASTTLISGSSTTDGASGRRSCPRAPLGRWIATTSAARYSADI